MGCDIHSFVMVPSSDAGLYQPIVSYTYSTYDYWRTVQPYDDRYYEMFGLLTAGCCRGNDYTQLGINPHSGRFNKALVDPSSIDPNHISDDGVSSQNPTPFNTIAIRYFDDENDACWHTHGWTSLHDLKQFKRQITRYLDQNNKTLDSDQRNELQYLKAAVKKMIINTTAMLNSSWVWDVDDAHVIVCFCFDS